MKVIQTKVSDEEFEKLKEIAESRGESVYQYLRMLVIRELQKEGSIGKERLPLSARVESIEERLQVLEEKIAAMEQELQLLRNQLKEIQEQAAGLGRWLNSRGGKR